MYSQFRLIRIYLQRPSLKAGQEKNGRPWMILLRIAAICVLTGGAAGVLSQLLIKRHLVPHPGPSILDQQHLSPFQFFIGAVFIAPVFEELIFRAQLKRFSFTLLFLAGIAGLLLSIVLKTYWAFLITPLLFFILFLVYRFTIAASVGRKFGLWQKLFPWHFHLTALCFALVHLGNFERGAALLPYGIVYTLPQLSIGLVLGYTRMTYGLKYSIAVHSLYNLFFMLLLFSKY